MVRISLNGNDFRKLVRGEIVEVKDNMSVSKVAEPVEISLQDIGFNVMLDAIKSMIEERDAKNVADRNPD